MGGKGRGVSQGLKRYYILYTLHLQHPKFTSCSYSMKICLKNNYKEKSHVASIIGTRKTFVMFVLFGDLD
jgi:hypothetical protein